MRSLVHKIGFAYDMLTPLFNIGIADITEGLYSLPPPPVATQTKKEYLEAQARKHDYLLTEAGCKEGSVLLDIGCGNGTLLQCAKARGARGYGITLSETQQERCQKQGLDVSLIDYRELPNVLHEKFDCVIASGSLEHFASIDDAIHSRVDRVYWEMFEMVRGLLRPGGRFVTTAIHFKQRGQVSPFEVEKGPYAHPREFKEYHFAMILERVLHGWYPYPGQLERCAQGLFTLTRETDGTYDYFLTSEFWHQEAVKNLFKPWVLLNIATILATFPKETYDAFRHYIWDKSWMWQFRGEDPPTRLFRHTWQKI